jgi:N-acetyl-gamma-glutamyl-phosphate reductase
LSNIKVGVVGASGYTGLELIKILITHPNFNINYLATSEGGGDITDIHPSLLGLIEFPVSKADIEEIGEKCEVIFLALPHKTAMSFVQKLMKFEKLKIVDLSADYRLKLDTYEKYYTKHIDSENIEKSVYGLPELFREQIKNSKLVANPGCYPTSAILGTTPFLKYRKEGTPIVIDAKSGVSGAGKKLSETTHFVTVHENLFSYNPLGHRHSPEIAEKIGVEDNFVHFVPHLLPATRGMLSSIYIQLESEIDPTDILEDFYRDEPFVRVRKTSPTMKDVAGTHFCDIFAKRVGNLLYISSAVDNLLRGASSQAVANANLMVGLDEETGIPKISYAP